MPTTGGARRRPTGTQCIADLLVLTRWAVPDVQWALQQPTTGFFVLSNSRSLSEADAAERNRQIVRAVAEASRLEGDVPFVLASRSDSTLRGHFPLETDVLSDELAQLGTPVDGVVICPAYVEPGRVTVGSVPKLRGSASSTASHPPSSDPAAARRPLPPSTPAG